VIDKSGGAQVMPGFPLARLNEETVKALAFSVQGAQLNQELKKYLVPITQFCATPLMVHAAYSLNVHNVPGMLLQSLQRIDRFHVLNRHTYRRRFLHRPEQQTAHFKILGVLCEQARVVRVWRPDSPSRIAELVDLIEQDLDK
jgi:hypothetical protein